MATDPDFPCSLTVDIPLPTARLATAALQALQVDKELSPLVHRCFSTLAPTDAITQTTAASPGVGTEAEALAGERSVLRTEYKATTNRMLRVAVNGFMESLGLVLGIMEELDVDVLGVESP
ncbi:uncharacterized protein L3040_009195 [Drepanopeziza brunnea f. sp. 'multigermtubi']|uniref:Transcription factor Pcc1 n=1 Tax=Marssonina brunnea f. sp. multigermtubi (strain MB_m1) TaxID=1072389 RepID=K1WR24_MARBU|nr:uncharacterized protein MBM_06104 [Drepanopeziza brunnea f. sp. 'multigermtubi' MB_m1]EKD15476.1 hypothetical protein MBM_06104 [Drepanopeziza brunnea f. sp. 'multigermtubi' MB_m1]KAJ5032597.1 hypothetical protein L3040_009195 [Drepanopeziza brunnea f. sp. 'multigermtubi']